MRNTALSIARRYLFSQKSTRVVNLISMITAFAMAVGTAALIIVMSVFNGFESLIKSLYEVFYTDIVIQAAEGKMFSLDDEMMQQIAKTDGVVYYTKVLEENVLAEYNGRQYIATLKGVDSNYYKVVDNLDSYIITGSKDLKYEQVPLCLMGAGIAYSLGINPSMPNAYVSLYMPRKDKTALSDIANAFRKELILPGGVFAVQQDFDNKFIIVPIDFMQSLMAEYQNLSAIELKLAKPQNANVLRDELQEKLGPGLKVKTRFQQNETLYKVMQTEKWVVFAILSFIVLIASFNIIGSLSMLVIEKQRDIATLRALGADKKLVRRIFLFEGLLMSLLGAFVGLVFGLIICLIQMHFGIVAMPGSSFLIQSYPVEVQWFDFVLIAAITVAISMLMAWLPAHRAVKNMSNSVPGRM